MICPDKHDYKGDILQYQLNKADVTHLVVDSNLVERISEIFDQLTLLKVVIVHADSDETLSLPSLGAVTAVLSRYASW